jgi:hypothetical protein
MRTNFINTVYPKYIKKVIHLTPKIYIIRMWIKASEETGSSSCTMPKNWDLKQNLERQKYRNSIQNQWLLSRNMKLTNIKQVNMRIVWYMHRNT